ncbi:MAG: aminotransferase class V-fold PLP-dependent enzyme [SAR202 cluster bacterium]|nr:aminotransferase class V-fold PLP-dependent enzyme [SAR202 cluster bacterium]
MSIYEEFGARTIINVSGASTRVGGALMPDEVVDAMAQAAKHSVSMTELQAAASRFIARITGAEAGYVTAGASAGLTLGTAAILAGMDPGKMERLPDTTGMKNEFIISREHRNGYDHAVRLAGAKLVEVGMNEIVAGAGVRRTEAWEFESAVTDKTAGIAYTATEDSEPPLQEIVHIARRHNIPVLVDAAGQIPPVANLKRFIEMGVDLVTFSGGKAIRGPQSSGVLCGRKKYIASVALQHLDMDEYFDIWEPPEDFISKKSIVGIPRHGIGRGFKVAKEEVIGLLTGLKLFAEGGYESSYQEQRRHLEFIADGVSGLPVQPRVAVPAEGSPVLHLKLDTKAIGKSAFDVSLELKRGKPGIFVQEMGLMEDTLIVHPLNLNQERTRALTQRLRQVLEKKKA